MMDAVPSREDPVDRAVRRFRRQLGDVFEDLRSARSSAGLSQKMVADRVGISRSRLSRIEVGDESLVPAEILARLAGVVGLDISLRAYPGGRRLRDGTQTRVLDRVRDRLGIQWSWQAEAPLAIPGDQRAWDLVGTHRVTGLVIWVEAESRLRDSQALLRRLALKRRDGAATRLILVLNDTRANREAAREAATSLAGAFPSPMRSAIPRLVEGEDPGGDVLVIL